MIFTHSRLSSHTKNKFPHSRLRRSWGNLSSVFLLSLSWVNIIVPFMTYREFLFPSLAAARLVKEISRPHFLKWQDWAIHILFSYTQLKKKNLVSFYIHTHLASGKVKNTFDSKVGLDRVFLFFAPPNAVRMTFQKLTAFFFLSWV